MINMNFNNKNKVLLLKIVIHVAALFPLLLLYVNAIEDQLGADPVKAVIHFTGIGALNLLLITLCVSPIAKYAKQAYVMQTRRLLGLYAFFYAFMHLLSFIVFDLQLDFSLLLSEIIKRPYITIGMLALLLLSLLAITSPNNIKRKLGSRWQKLHNFIYVTVALAAIHFYWSVKLDVTEPMIYFVLIFLLLLIRKQKILRWFGFR